MAPSKKMKNCLKLLSPKVLQVIHDRLCLALSYAGGKTAGGKKKKSVCLLRLDGMGDLIIFLDAIRGYGEYFKKDEYRITVIAENWLCDLLKNDPDADEVIGLDGKRFRKDRTYRLQFLKMIRRKNFDVFVNSCILRELTFGDILAYASRAGRRYGFSAQPDQIRERLLGDRFYTGLISDPKWTVHEIERNAALVRAAGHKEFKTGQPRLRGSGPPGKGGYFVLVPGASFESKRWPPERFAELALVLHSKLGLVPVLIGSEADRELAGAIMGFSPEVPWKNETGKLGLAELAYTLAGADFTVSNCSGPMHLSLAAGTTTFVLAPGGEFTAYPNYPGRLKQGLHVISSAGQSCFDCRWNCKYAMDKKEKSVLPCVLDITVSAAVTAVMSYQMVPSN